MRTRTQHVATTGSTALVTRCSLPELLLKPFCISRRYSTVTRLVLVPRWPPSPYSPTAPSTAGKESVNVTDGYRASGSTAKRWSRSVFVPLLFVTTTAVGAGCLRQPEVQTD